MKTAKEFLGGFAAFMRDPEVAQREKVALWDVLTALRGPDYSGPEDVHEAADLKTATTCVVRDALGLTPARFETGFSSHPDELLLASVRCVLNEKPSSHFVAHARRAFDALGLAWLRVNLRCPHCDAVGRTCACGA